MTTDDSPYAPVLHDLVEKLLGITHYSQRFALLREFGILVRDATEKECGEAAYARDTRWASDPKYVPGVDEENIEGWTFFKCGEDHLWKAKKGISVAWMHPARNVLMMSSTYPFPQVPQAVQEKLAQLTGKS